MIPMGTVFKKKLIFYYYLHSVIKSVKWIIDINMFITTIDQLLLKMTTL